MKRLGILMLTLIGLTSLLGGCGGQEETGILAVAFRLDEGSPAMSAYIGDPTRDPFELPAGPYYIEAVDQDDVVISLGSVNIEDDDVVDFPADFEAAGGVADEERAEPLITLAGFLIDVELAEYTFLEIVTGGFSESPFDPALELQTADFDGLLAMYDEIAAQEDAVMAALSEVEGRAEVSLGILYVRSPWAPAPQLFGGCHQAVGSYYDSLHGCENKGILAGVIEDCDPMRWRTLEEIEEIELRAQAYEREHQKWERAEDAGRRLRELQGEWREYASGLAGPGGRAALEERIRRDLGALLSAADDPARARVRDRLTESFVNRVALENPQLRRTATPVATPTPSPTPIATPTATPSPTPTPIPEETPTPEETPVITPEPTETPAAEETPTAEAQQVTTVGQFAYYVKPECAIEQNTMTLTFNTSGGEVTGEGDAAESCPPPEGCPGTGDVSFHWQFRGTYSPDSKTFSGTFDEQDEVPSHTFSTQGDEKVCTFDGLVTRDYTGTWQATLEDGVVSGSHDGVGPLKFNLSVQS